jgi:hypothetical protein
LNVWNGVVLEKTRRFIWMWRQNAPNSKSALNHLFSFNCIPAEFEPRPYIWPRFSLWSLASELCNWALNWSINFQFLQLGPWIN